MQFYYDVTMTARLMSPKTATPPGLIALSGTDKAVPFDELLVPMPENVRLIKGMLMWKAGIPRSVIPTSRLLRDFMALAEEGLSPDDFKQRLLEFTHQWGVIEMCEHRLPASHAEACKPARLGDLEWFKESYVAWRKYARTARSLVAAGDRLSNKEPVSREDWKRIGQLDGLRNSELFRDKKVYGWDRINIALNVWLNLAHVKIVLHRSKDQWVIGFGGHRSKDSWLFGALGVQLLIAVTSTDGVTFCNGCNKLYLPERRPNPQRRRYCANCREKGVPVRDAARAYRQRGA